MANLYHKAEHHWGWQTYIIKQSIIEDGKLEVSRRSQLPGLTLGHVSEITDLWVIDTAWAWHMLYGFQVWQQQQSHSDTTQPQTIEQWTKQTWTKQPLDCVILLQIITRHHKLATSMRRKKKKKKKKDQKGDRLCVKLHAYACLSQWATVWHLIRFLAQGPKQLTHH